ncbi:SLATT domain-containing protein [Candidatus Riflebacteria bacterium]
MGNENTAEAKGAAKKVALIVEIRQLYIRLVYSHRLHQDKAEKGFMREKQIKVNQISLSFLVTGLLLYFLFGLSSNVKVIVVSTRASAVCATAFSIFLCLLNVYAREYRPGAIAEQHHNMALKIMGIRDRLLSLLYDLEGDLITPQKALKRRDKLQNYLTRVYNFSPETFPDAYSEAESSLKKFEVTTYSDSEIDELLPKNLRRTM